MATYTWKGGQGTGLDANDASVGANWITSDGTTAVPGAGDTILEPAGLGAGLSLDFGSGSALNGNTITVGSGDVLNFATSTLSGVALVLATSDTLTVNGGTLTGTTIQAGTASASGDVININTAFVDGGTLTGGAGLVLNLYDSTLSGMNMTLAGDTTVNATGDTAQTGTLIAQGTSYASVPGVAITGGGMIMQSGTASGLVFNASGNVAEDAFIVANSPGGSVTLNTAPLVSAGNTLAGVLMSTNGVIAIDENVVIAGAANASFGNDDHIIVSGGSLSVAARQLAVTGDFALLSTATADIGNALPSAQSVIFTGTGDLLKIEAGAGVLQGFDAAIAGFQSGDTIELVGVTGLATSYGHGVLTLTQGSTAVGALRFIANQALDSALGADGFTLTESGGSTFITTAAVNAMLGGVSSGGTVDWGNSASWVGSVPGPTDVAVIGVSTAELSPFLAGTNPSYTLTVSSNQTTGAVIWYDPFGTLVISATLTLQRPQAGATGGGSFVQPFGSVDIATGGTLAATSYLQNGFADLVVATGALLSLSGQAPSAAAVGWQALDIENTASIDGRVNATGGGIQIGTAQYSQGEVRLENGGSVAATFTQLGGQAYGNGNLFVSGSGSTWQDVGDAGNTADASPYLGDLVIGGGGYNSAGTITALAPQDGPNGFGAVFVQNGGTLIDAGFGILGVTGFGVGNTDRGQGSAFIDNDGTWSLGAGLEVGGSHLYSGGTLEGGAGNLEISGGGTVSIGTIATAGLYKLALALTPGSQGMVNVSGKDGSGHASLLDASQGPVVIGEAGSAALAVADGGRVEAGTNATAGFGWATMIGDQAGSSGTVTVGSGSGNALFSIVGNMIDGNAGQGVANVHGGGTMTVAGTLFIGGVTGPGAGGTLSADSGGVVQANAVRIWQGSTLNASSGAGGSVVIGGGPATGGIEVSAGGTIIGAGAIGGNLVDNGVVIAGVAGQTLMINGGVTGTGTLMIRPGATLAAIVGTGSAAVAFTGTGEVLSMPTPGSLTGPISGFGRGDTIDLPNVVFPPSQTLSYDGTAGVLHFNPTGIGVQMAFGVGTGYTRTDFATHAEPSGSGTEIVYVACFVAGTRIATAQGEVAVESLAPGMRALLSGGGSAEIVWLGHRNIECGRHPRPHDVMPVRVRAGAFGEGMPRRDLMLSPDHAVFTGGVLIPVRYLLNGATVVQERVASVTYWHVELAGHYTILADGLPCESYLDTGNRGAFVNGGAAIHMHPDFARRVWEAKSCAPLVLDGPCLAVVKRDLLTRAVASGEVITDDPDLHVVGGSRALRAETDGRLWRIRLPRATRTVRLVSRVWIPAHTRPGQQDTRALGVAISRLWLNGREASLDGPALGAGWHDVEPGWRWTGGDAALAVAGVRELIFEVAITGSYWREKQDGDARVA